ncbi:hypothetical protein RWE87_13495 [Sinorhizobium meliloti]|uniref:hypothetical protein n=1 Tax=Rhizobium meliloti TaxID=382 RepID=UPI00299D5B3E|nr:hypothetical protein [Sinorhizobium meliloti]
MAKDKKVTEPDEIIDGVPVFNGKLEDLGNDLAWTFPISIGRSQEERDWKTKDFTLIEFLGQLFDHKVSKKKNGPCFMQGALVKGVKQRTIPNVRELNFMVLDIDSGQPMEEVRQELVAQDLFAVLYTTYSNGTTRTQIKKTELIQKLKLEAGDEVTTQHVKFYLQHHKRYDKRILESCSYAGEEHVEGGVMVFVDHVPMEKYRIVLPLNTAFVLAKECGGDERKAREKWKRLYVGVAHQLGASYDRSCTDISRLFFWPTHKAGADFKVEVVMGDNIDLSTITEMDPKELENSNPFTEAGIDDGDEVPLENGWLKTWMRGKYVHFAAASFFENYYDQRNRNGEKVTTQCPFDDGHGNAGDSADQGFFCTDGDSDEKSFSAFCSHDSCSMYRKLNFVDKAVSEFGLTEEDLDQFVPEGIDEVPVDADKDGEDGVDPLTLSGDELIQYRIDHLKVGDVDALDKVMKLLLDSQLENLKATFYLKQVAKNSGVSLGDIKKEYNRRISQANRDHADRKAEEERSVEIPYNGDFEEQVSSTIKGIKLKNQPPKIFHADNQIIRVSKVEDKGVQRELVSKDQFAVFINENMKFYVQTDQGRRGKSAPNDVITHVYNMPRSSLPVPYLKRIAKHPVLSDDGEFQMKAGYDPYTSVYLDIANKKILKVPDVPTDEDLDEAYGWLFERDGLLGDFPFQDEGDDDSDDPDHIVGEATKAHVLALFMLPFIRDLISGPVPAFVINKPMPGAGSGLFANVFNLTINEEVCPTFAPPRRAGDDEELGKLITSKILTNPDTPMFFDNVERLESNSLASAITSGNWAGRKLGQSEVVNFPIRHIWMFSGNNIDPSDELARRMVPINIMPKDARPELRTDFYHSDLTGWCRKHRPELIWAICVFIKNWVAKGMPDGTKKFGSFEDWARVTGGILEAGGVGGFLDNLSSWRNLSSTGNQDDVDVIDGLIKEIGMDKFFKTGELFEQIYDDTTGKLDVDVPLRGRDRHSLKSGFGKYLSFRKEKPYVLGDGRTVKLQAKGKAGNAVRYRFIDVNNPPTPEPEPERAPPKNTGNGKKKPYWRDAEAAEEAAMEAAE